MPLVLRAEEFGRCRKRGVHGLQSDVPRFADPCSKRARLSQQGVGLLSRDQAQPGRHFGFVLRPFDLKDRDEGEELLLPGLWDLELVPFLIVSSTSQLPAVGVFRPPDFAIRCSTVRLGE